LPSCVDPPDYSGAMTVRIAPSFLTADFGHLATELARIDQADWVHFDIMDGHFVPSMTIGLPVFEQLCRYAPAPKDAHLMIENPDHWAPRYAEAGADSVTFHIEASKAPIRLARELRAMGVRAGVALRPATPVEPVLDLLEEFDMILIMTVEPGFGGQSFIEAMLPKIARTRAAIKAAGLDVWVQADGGISRETIGRAAEAGVNMFVAGSAVYNADDANEEIEILRQLAMKHAH
jgi:ribulose-phosphate 3-epimerase